MAIQACVSLAYLPLLPAGTTSRFAGVVVPIYLGELAPPTLRGTLGTLTQFAMVIGILASNLMAFPFATPTGWRYLFAMTPALAAVELACMRLIFESPRYACWLSSTASISCPLTPYPLRLRLCCLF